MRAVKYLVGFIILIGCSSNDLIDNTQDKSSTIDSSTFRTTDSLSKSPLVVKSKDPCVEISNLENLNSIINDYYIEKYYLDSIYKYMPLCLDGEYSDLFKGIYLKQLEKKPIIFFDYFTKNNFSDDEKAEVINYFVGGIYDEISNQIEENNSGENEIIIKGKFDAYIKQLFTNMNLDRTNKEISLQFQDSLLGYNKRY